jgi:uncharacterized protein (TIGR02246 family)
MKAASAAFFMEGDMGAGTLIRNAGAVAALLGSFIAFAGSADAEPPIEDVRAIAQTMSAATGSGDADAIAALYAPNALVLPPNGAVVSGRDAIRATHVANQAAGASALEFGQLRVVGDEQQATAIWTWTLTITPEGKPPVAASGRSMLYLERGESGWQILLDMFQTY